jgi:ribonuclease P protein component
LGRQFTLGKEERLKSRKIINQLFEKGSRFTVMPFRVLYETGSNPPGKVSPLRVGISVSSRNFKKAVDRNRIKRLTREAYRLQKSELSEMLKRSGKSLHLFLVYSVKEMPEYQTVCDKVHVILNKLLKLINEDNVAHT